MQKETQSIVKEVEVTSNTTGRLNVLRNVNKKHVMVVLEVILMSKLSGMGILTTYLVDIFSSTGIQEFTLVLTTGLAEMIFSFLQMVIADKLGRFAFTIYFGNCLEKFKSIIRKTFLLISLFGCSVTTFGFGAIFWQSSTEQQTFPISLVGYHFNNITFFIRIISLE